MWNYYILVWSNNTRTEDYVEGCYFDGDGIPVCCDPSVAKQFTSFQEAVNYALTECKLPLGEFKIEAIYE